MKKAVFRMGLIVSLAGLVFCATSCRMWGFGRSKTGEPLPPVILPTEVVSSEAPEKVEELAKPEAPEAAEAPQDAPAAVEAAPEAPAPWYKFWAGRKSKVTEKAGLPGGVQKPPELPPEARPMFSPSGEPLIKVGYTLRLSIAAGGKIEVADQVKTVSDKGTISMPLIGGVRCEGLTLKELADKLGEQYGQFIREPQVAADFVYENRAGEISPWGAVIVWGAVRSPGRVNIPATRELTVSRAIQLSGGMEKGANEESIAVQRPQKGRIVVDLLSAAKRGMPEKDIRLQPGDVVYVPLSVW